MKHNSIPPEPEIVDRYCLPVIEHHATAIGYICITFAAVEFEIDEMIRDALNCSDAIKRAVASNAGRLENRVKILRHCLLSEAHPDLVMGNFAKLVVRLERCVKLRNRVVHDCWINRDTPMQINQTAAIGKSSSFGRESSLDAKIIERPLQDLWKLHKNLLDLQAQLTVFRSLFATFRSRELPQQ